VIVAVSATVAPPSTTQPTEQARDVPAHQHRLLLPLTAREPQPTSTPTATITPTASKTATATPSPTPFFTDDFDARRNGWVEMDLDLDSRGYWAGGYRVAVEQAGYYATSLIDIHANSWTAKIDLTLRGDNRTRRAGIAFGSSGQTCNAAVPDCYRFYLSSNGAVVLVYQAPDGTSQTREVGAGPPIDSSSGYSLWVTRRETNLTAWVSADGERSWSEVARTILLEGAARGTYLGFAAAAADEAGGGAEAVFDNLRVWRPDDVPPP
jgi:hypothetical protein